MARWFFLTLQVTVHALQFNCICPPAFQLKIKLKTALSGWKWEWEQILIKRKMLCLEKNNYCQRYNKEGRIIICCCIQGPKELFRPFKMRPRCNWRQKGKVQIIAELVDLCHFTWNSEKQRWEHWARKMPGALPGVARGQVKLSGAPLQGSTQHCPFREI